MKHINITSQNCSGCTACASVCPKQSISFSEDSEGFLVPVVDEETCINCGKCLQTCPSIGGQNDLDDHYKVKAYAFKNNDDVIRSRSASGALFPAFAEYFILILHGYVCGCVLDENLNAKHIVSNKWSDVLRMQDSKYVQSDMSHCFPAIGRLLLKGDYVLFSGTSCQVAGLKSCLKKRKIPSDRLLTIDFFCHGVPSPLVWKEYIKYYERKNKCDVVDFHFRNKNFGWGKTARGAEFLSVISYRKSNLAVSYSLKKDSRKFLARMWPRIFFSNLCIRPYCHRCAYTKIGKPADITMGDFWGIEKMHPNFDDHKGCSLALIRSEKAYGWLNALTNKSLLEVNISDVIERQANAFNPSVAHPMRNQFWIDFKNGGMDKVLPKYFNYTKLQSFKEIIKYCLFLLNIKRYQK